MKFDNREKEDLNRVEEMKTAVYEKEKMEKFLLQKVKEKQQLNEEKYFDELEMDSSNVNEEFKTKPEQQLSVVEEKSLDDITKEILANPESNELSDEFLSQLDSEEMVQYFMKNIDRDKLAEDFYSQMDAFKMTDNIKNISYYDKYEINGVILEDVYVVTKNKVVDGKVVEDIELYMKNEDSRIAQINDDGSIEVDEKVAALINEDELSKENVIDNKENMKSSVRQISSKEMQQILLKSQEKEMEKGKEKSADKSEEKDEDSEKDEKDSKDSKEEKSDKENDEDKKLEEKNKEKKIEKDLAKKGFPKDLGIMNYKKIIDSRMAQEFPESVEGTREVGVAYSSKLNAFICISKTDEGYIPTKGIGLSRPTMHSVMSIDEDGDTVEKKVPTATMGTNKKNKEISITIDTYGYYDIERVDKLPGNQRIANRLEGQGERERVTKEVKDSVDMSKHSKADMEEYIDNYNQNVELGDTEQTKDDIERKKDFVFKKADGTEVSLDEVARRNHLSFDEMWDKFEKADGSNAEEKLDNAIDKINDEYTHGHYIRERTMHEENNDNNDEEDY